MGMRAEEEGYGGLNEVEEGRRDHWKIHVGPSERVQQGAEGFAQGGEEGQVGGEEQDAAFFEGRSEDRESSSAAETVEEEGDAVRTDGQVLGRWEGEVD